MEAKVTLLANALRLVVLLVAAPAAVGVAWAVALAAATLVVAATVVAVTASAIVAAAVVTLLGNLSHVFFECTADLTLHRDCTSGGGGGGGGGFGGGFGRGGGGGGGGQTCYVSTRDDVCEVHLLTQLSLAVALDICLGLYFSCRLCV